MQDIENLVPAEKEEDADDVEVGSMEPIDVVGPNDSEAEYEGQNGAESEADNLRHGCCVEEHTVSVGVSVYARRTCNLSAKLNEVRRKQGKKESKTKRWEEKVSKQFARLLRATQFNFPSIASPKREHIGVLCKIL